LLTVLPIVTPSQTTPNLILLLSDDTGHYNVGFTNPAMHTPTMNRLATEEGVILSNHYTFKFCSPTRSSLMSGRLPIHVNQQNYAEWGWTGAPVHMNMKMLPQKLKQGANYSTHHIGKWHLGLASPKFTPVNRGFDARLGFLSGSEEHYSQLKGCVGSGVVGKLWDGLRPGYGLNGTYSGFMHTQRAVEIITQHAEKGDTRPLFMYIYCLAADPRTPGGTRSIY
jgi:arylsulfatase I/J